MRRAPTQGPTRGRTWVVGALALTALLVTGGAAQSAIGDSPAAKKAVRDYQLDGNQQAATGGKVRLFVHVKKNSAGKFVPKYVGAMFAYGHTVNCDEGEFPGKRTFSTQADIPVDSDGKFKYSFQSFKAKFTGTITKQGKKAVGTVSFGPNDLYDSGSLTTYHNCVLPKPDDYTALFTKTV
jgi:hypothetical protein